MRLQRRSAFGWPGTAAGYAPCKNGLVVHYDGSNQSLAGKSHSACVAYWKNTRKFHMGASRGWADIGYSYAACPHGYVLEGRGWQRQQAAQPGGNSTWTSVTLMTGPSEDPTNAQINAVRELRAWLRGEGLGPAVRGHRDFISTSCPGDRLYRLVKNGTFGRAPSEEDDDMPISDDDAKKIARAVWQTDGIVAAPPNKVAEGNSHWQPSSYLYWGYQQGTNLLGLVGQLAQQAPDVDADAVAAAVLAQLTPERIAAAIPGDLAQQVVDALAERLTPNET